MERIWAGIDRRGDFAPGRRVGQRAGPTEASSLDRLDDAATLLDALAREADMRPDPRAPRRRLRDPNDDYLVALAEVTGAVIVTGDEDLMQANLVLRAIAPRALIERLGPN